ncbi:hypothetical protein [Streptomyces sp. NBC_00690]|uniref:hypothetical protein n=1 Tax=Streptomyces sp. NBC_00690 TaxID=2975808 RepID=UPI002E2CC978|nr:hypothetical protein [Streptomyces sp. NBC_00690]
MTSARTPSAPDSTASGPEQSDLHLADLRRLLAFRAHGAARLLLRCRARLEDIEGAVAAGQTEVAVLMAYDLVQSSLSVRGLRTEGEVSIGGDQVSFDPFAGVPATDVEAGLLLAAEGREAVGDHGEQWVERLREHLRDTEALLGYSEPLPDVRSASGLMKGFKLARTWQPHLLRVGLPDLLPDAWTRRAD